MNITALVRRLQDNHRAGVTDEIRFTHKGNEWIVRLFDDNDIKELQLIRIALGETILFRCKAMWRSKLVGEVFEKAVTIFDEES